MRGARGVPCLRKCCDGKSFHISLQHFRNCLTINNLGKGTWSWTAVSALLALVGIQCSQAPSAPGGPALLITHLADFCFLLTSLRKIHADREVASKLETFSFFNLKGKKGNRNISPQRPLPCTPMFTIPGFLVSKLKHGLLLTVLAEILSGRWQSRAFKSVHRVQGGLTLFRNALQC